MDAEVVVVGFEEVVFAAVVAVVVVGAADVVEAVVDDVVERGVDDDVFSSRVSSVSSSDEFLASSTRLLPTRGDPAYLAVEAWLPP